MNIFWFVAYNPRPCGKNDWEASNFIRAIKRRASCERFGSLDTDDLKQAEEWFGQVAGCTLALRKLPSPWIFVPVPHTECLWNAYELPRTLNLARAVARHSKAGLIADVLRWKRLVRSSHRGGTRKQEDLYDNLMLLNRSLPEGTCILVDDVWTTGNHIRAAAARLLAAKRVCLNAICVGKTTAARSESNFAVSHERVHDSVFTHNDCTLMETGESVRPSLVSLMGGSLDRPGINAISNVANPIHRTTQKEALD